MIQREHLLVGLVVEQPHGAQEEHWLVVHARAFKFTPTQRARAKAT